jgi:hypothetical protein
MYCPVCRLISALGALFPAFAEFGFFRTSTLPAGSDRSCKPSVKVRGYARQERPYCMIRNGQVISVPGVKRCAR